MRYRLFHFITAIAIYLVLYGCINLGPDYQRPDLGIQTPESYEFTPDKTRSLVVENHWWEVFGDRELNQYVDEALKYNWNIKLAAARILEARAQYVRVRADRFPTVNTSAQRQRRVLGEVTTDTYTLSAPASFELDLWSKLKKASQAAWDDILQEEEVRRTVAQSVVAEVITLYLEMEAVERRLQIAEQSIKAFRESLQFAESRYRRGLTSVLDVRQARRVLAGAETIVPQLEQDLGIIQQQISVLSGRYPETQAPRMQPEEYYKQLAPVPPGLPSDLLWQRPDIRAAEARLRSLNNLVGLAKASRLPTFTLTGSYGWAAFSLSDLSKKEFVAWDLAAGIVQPVFVAGRLKAGQRAAEARYQQGVADYVQTVLDAFAEVERALLTRQTQLDRRARELRFLEEARATQQVAEKRYIRGLVNYLDVLNAQITRFQAEDSIVLVDLAIYSNRVALHRALGGGWGEPLPVEVKDDGIFFDF